MSNHANTPRPAARCAAAPFLPKIAALAYRLTDGRRLCAAYQAARATRLAAFYAESSIPALHTHLQDAHATRELADQALRVARLTADQTHQRGLSGSRRRSPGRNGRHRRD